MKRILLVLFLSIFLVQGVNAETLTFEYKSSGYAKEYSNQGWTYLNLDSFYEENIKFSQNNLDDLYDYAIDYYNNKSDEYPYYAMSVLPTSSGENFTLLLWLHLSQTPLTYNTMFNCNKSILFTFNGEEYDINDGWNYCKPYSYGFDNIFNSKASSTYEGPYFNPLVYYSSNYELVFDLDDIYIVNNYQNKILTFNNGDIIPTYYDSFISSKYIEVNLDDYEYVILSLKDYTSNDAFDTNLKVKGMVGITPVYEFGTVEKEYITDRCNLSYSEYTDYRFFILKNDLLNNAVYYVKSCEENSSFKFNSSLFNITYITADNANAPSIAVGNNTYNIIPFNKLTTTANSNESNNFIPGESGSSLSDAINNTGKYIDSFWNSLVTIMGFATKFFNTLPIEIRSISITTFCTAITLGIIKFIKS